MAIRINLLPWREELRKKRTKTTSGFLIGGLILGVLASALAYLYFAGKETDLNNAVAKVKSETSKLDKKLAEKKQLETLKVKINNQISSIKQLQSKRATSTHVMEDFANAIPDELFIRLFELKDTQITIEGVAINDAKVSELMVNIDKSPWFKTPTLTYINRENDIPDEAKNFQLTTRVVNPNGEEDEQ